MKYQQFLSDNEKLTKEWHPTKNGHLLPENTTVLSNRKVWWKCEKGHEWEAQVYSRSAGNGCPYCAGKRAIKGTNDLATTHPKLAKEWHSLKNGDMKPSDIMAGSRKKVWWQCEHGHEWEAKVYTRSEGANCPCCAGKKAIKGTNDLATTHPGLAKQWHPTKNGELTPSDVMAGSRKRVWWQCEQGHEWEAKVYSRSQGRGCPYCSGKKARNGETDLATTNPELVTQWHSILNGKLTPQDVTSGSQKKVWWKCNKGHEWQAVIAHRALGVGCPFCARRKVLVGFNDLATTNPQLALEWHPTKNGELTPRDVMAGSRKKVWWKCNTCSHEWEAVLKNRKNGTRCPVCAKNKRTEKL